MALVDQKRTVRFPLPDLIVRNQAHKLSAPVYLDGALVAPTSGTVTVYNRSNTAVISAQAGTVTDSVISYDIGSGDLSAQDLNIGWRVEWTLTMATAPTALIARNSAALIRFPLNPVVADVDIKRRIRSLDPAAPTVIHREADLQDFIDEAWCELMHFILSIGARPNQIMNPDSLRMPHMYGTILLAGENLETRSNLASTQFVERYQQRYQQALNKLKWEDDPGDDGQSNTPERLRSAIGSVWLSSRGNGRTW